MSASGVPLQTLSQGKCDCPGCPYGKSMEGGQVHPYCSRTCAHKHKQMQGSFHAQKLAQANQAGVCMYWQTKRACLYSRLNVPNKYVAYDGHYIYCNACKNCEVYPKIEVMHNNPIIAHSHNNIIVAMMGGSHGGPMTAGPQGMSGAQPPTVKMCKVCKVQPANPGRSWCESCYKKQQQQPKV